MVQSYCCLWLQIDINIQFISCFLLTACDQQGERLCSSSRTCWRLLCADLWLLYKSITTAPPSEDAARQLQARLQSHSLDMNRDLILNTAYTQFTYVWCLKPPCIQSKMHYFYMLLKGIRSQVAAPNTRCSTNAYREYEGMLPFKAIVTIS